MHVQAARWMDQVDGCTYKQLGGWKAWKDAAAAVQGKARRRQMLGRSRGGGGRGQRPGRKRFRLGSGEQMIPCWRVIGSTVKNVLILCRSIYIKYIGL